MLLAVVLIATAGGAYLYLDRSRPTAEPTPANTVTITAPPPTPTVTPSPRESLTAFYNQIPSEVGAYALVATATPDPDFEAAGAYDSYALTYSDGAHEITLSAGQWRSEADAADAFDELGGHSGWPGEVDLTDTVCPEPSEADTDALWRNTTAIFQVKAPDGGAAQFFCLMPM
jgi:hypothetical protein